jgi:hypothetical protein
MEGPAWALVSTTCLHNKFRDGLWEYRLKTQFVSRIPIPTASGEARHTIGFLADSITDRAHARYALHQRTQRQLQRDLGTADKALNQKLTAWWELDFNSFRGEISKVFKTSIPVKELNQWDEWLSESRKEHQRLTGEIVDLETELNECVYRLFDLTAEEIRLIEECTKYRYGEV